MKHQRNLSSWSLERLQRDRTEAELLTRERNLNLAADVIVVWIAPFLLLATLVQAASASSIWEIALWCAFAALVAWAIWRRHEVHHAVGVIAEVDAELAQRERDRLG